MTGVRRMWRALRNWGRAFGGMPDHEWSRTAVIRSHVQTAARADAFHAAGYRGRTFFPHAVHILPKVAPDGLKYSTWMCAAGDVRQLWQVALFALDPVRALFPAELYADRELNWHGQQFGRTGHVATACIRVAAGGVYVLNMHSDLVQRAARRPEFRTRIDNRFRGWPRLMVHALAAHTLEAGLTRLYIPASGWAMEHTDPHRRVRPELFERVYDRAAQHHFAVTRDGRWWRIDLSAQRDRIIPFARHEEPVSRPRTICVMHDIERGHGHRDVAPAFARRADTSAAAALTAMLAAEQKVGVRATYTVVGCFLNDVRPEIEQGGHCIGFHSFDHSRRRRQLNACRDVDYRLKGYRAPRSRLTRETKGSRLAWHDFEWLASSSDSLGVTVPALVNRIVRIPVRFDDFPLHRGAASFEEWSRDAMETVERNDFVAFGLHDCYASHWLPRYEAFLDELSRRGTLRTLDDAAADLYLSAGI